MSYIGEPFTHDLFVSYSHGTIEGAALSPLKRWSDAFIRELERELRTNPKYARDLRIFFDDHRQSAFGVSGGIDREWRDDAEREALGARVRELS